MENLKEPVDIIDIPRILNDEMFQRNEENAYKMSLNHCPCCGKAITNPKYFINSIYGGCAYPSSDKQYYKDAWVMMVGSECRKKFPNGYVMTETEL
jgi:hypothetical protein